MWIIIILQGNRDPRIGEKYAKRIQIMALKNLVVNTMPQWIHIFLKGIMFTNGKELEFWEKIEDNKGFQNDIQNPLGFPSLFLLTC